ncbi:hypothetical protein ABBQ38_013704 [Trebouxia sp. C0009 RCD-2024]
MQTVVGYLGLASSSADHHFASAAAACGIALVVVHLELKLLQHLILTFAQAGSVRSCCLGIFSLASLLWLSQCSDVPSASYTLWYRSAYMLTDCLSGVSKRQCTSFLTAHLL